jgi:hypothetical protein
MAKDKRILLNFSEDIIAGTLDNQGAFIVTGKKYKYVGGPLLDTTYPVIATHRPLPANTNKLFTSADLDAGKKLSVQTTSSIQLAPIGG